MKMKLTSLAVKTKQPEMPVTTKQKTTVEIPEIRLDTRMSGMKGLHGCKVGDKYRLVFDAEVKADRSPEDWDIKNGGYKPTDRIVTFKLVKGSATHEAKSVADAKKGMMDEYIEERKEKKSGRV